jgi:hypothetical protein
MKPIMACHQKKTNINSRGDLTNHGMPPEEEKYKQ